MSEDVITNGDFEGHASMTKPGVAEMIGDGVTERS